MADSREKRFVRGSCSSSAAEAWQTLLGLRVPGRGLHPAAVCRAMSRVLLGFPSRAEESRVWSPVPPWWREGFVGSGHRLLSVGYGGTQPCRRLSSPLLGPCMSTGRLKVTPGSFFLTPNGGRSLSSDVPVRPVVSGKVHSSPASRRSVAVQTAPRSAVLLSPRRLLPGCLRRTMYRSLSSWMMTPG